MKLKRNNGITLIALVITIIILLILAGITINQLTGDNGLFTRAKEAKQNTIDAQEKENAILEDYLAQINEETGINILANKVNSGEIKIGDYIKYTPDTLDTNSEEYKTLVSNWGETYSGSTNNSSSNLIQDTTLNWRVLDVQDGKVRLISDKPTSNTVTLSGYQGYNNAVYLLDSACNTLYKSSLASKVQSLKIEDLQDKIKETDYSKFTSNYGKIITTTTKYYPTILTKEKGQTVGENVGTEIGLSEQKELIKQTTKQQDVLRIKETYWIKEMNSTDFVNEKYYELFINKSENYLEYWISSRCIDVDSADARFLVRLVVSNKIRGRHDL